ncbi:MAG: site-specific DNA-methyltransferase [Minisyncoccia bacterium]
MNHKINKQDIDFLIECLKSGKEIPDVYKYAIFPTKQKEYELVYSGKMRKEDVLADNEEAKPVPLQIEKIFSDTKQKKFYKNWQNLLVFGDNLQILKTLNDNRDSLIKNKVKGKVKLIYIDPPFGTGDEYEGSSGQKGYSAKRKGSDFVEFVRRRLIIAKELLHEDGFICVRQAYNFGFEIKIVLDEVFGKQNFRNEILINKANKQGAIDKRFNPSTEFLFLYSKSDNSRIKPIYIDRNKKISWINAHSPKENNNNHSISYKGNILVAPKGRHWTFSQKRLEELDGLGRIRLVEKSYVDVYDKKQLMMIQYLTSDKEVLESNWTDIPSYSFGSGYPTENSEVLLQRVIQSCTDVGDLVIDFFAGSGTTAIVSEKMGRRWLVCDIGKLSIYTIQKRLLELDQSKDLENVNKKYNNSANPFAVAASGLYDLSKVFALQKDEYINFVKDLFEIEEVKTKTIGGVGIDGKKREFYVKIFPYWELRKASVDEVYLEELHKNVGSKIDGRFYIIVPANNVNFISDYYQIGNVRYYFLKVPYQIIKELHKVQFKKFRQPQSKNQINDLDDAIGFHFMRQPEVKSEIKKSKDRVVLKVSKFESAYSQDETGEKLKNFESLAMLLVDLNYDDEKFMLTNYFFAQDLIHNNKGEDDESGEEIRQELKNQKEILREFLKKDCGSRIMVIYIDIYGNEFREVFKI